MQTALWTVKNYFFKSSFFLQKLFFFINRCWIIKQFILYEDTIRAGRRVLSAPGKTNFGTPQLTIPSKKVVECKTWVNKTKFGTIWFCYIKCKDNTLIWCHSKSGASAIARPLIPALDPMSDSSDLTYFLHEFRI